MATITANKDAGFVVKDAHGIVANMTCFSPAMPTNRTSKYRVEFPAADASSPKAMVSSLSRILPGGGTQSSSILVSSETMTAVTVPLGVFPGRRVSYTVTDDAGTGLRVVEVTVRSLDGSGVNEQWKNTFGILVATTDLTTFDLKVAAAMTIDSVDVTL
jgi:hypothetical protein